MYLSDIASFARLPEPKRELLDFRWLALEGGIPVLEGYSSFAIPVAGGNVAGARLFLSWIFQPEIQARLLDTAAFKRLRGFGLAGGFPVLREVSERILPRTHGFLIGRLARRRPVVAAATGRGLLGRGKGTGSAAMAAGRGRRRHRIGRPAAGGWRKRSAAGAAAPTYRNRARRAEPGPTDRLTLCGRFVTVGSYYGINPGTRQRGRREGLEIWQTSNSETLPRSTRVG